MRASGKAPCPRAFFREPLAHDSPNTELVLGYFASYFILSWKSNCFNRLFAFVPITRSNYFLVYFTTQLKSRLPVSLFFVFCFLGGRTEATLFLFNDNLEVSFLSSAECCYEVLANVMQGQMQVTGRNIHIHYLASPYKNFGSLKGEKSPERYHVT